MKNFFKKIEAEKFLHSFKREEFRKNRGKLKIFFGMAAGVGKTYTMLEYAHRLKNEGVDIVIGYIEAHGRIDTEKLTAGIEVIERKKIEYRGAIFHEMDIDAIIKRKPQAVLVDELAHTNISGSRHPKRYHDVLEIIDYGIDVYTTLNIQHLESYSASVEGITGIKVSETLPDGMLEYADDIELVDITPEELLKRFEDGKVYSLEKSKIAIDNFFKKENLIALREMSLRYTAKKVDRQLQEILETKKEVWKTGERLLVAISPSPNSQYIVKWAKRASYNLKADWIAVYVERKVKLGENEEASLKKNLDLARQLGAELIVTHDDNIVNGILRIAFQKNVSQIVVGKTFHRNFLEKLAGSGIIDRLVKESGDIDVNVISEPGIKIKHSTLVKLKIESSIKSSYKKYILSILIISLVTVLNLFLSQLTGYWTIALIYLLIVTICAFFLDMGPVVLAAALSAVLWNFLFIPPRFTFYIAKIEDLFMFIMYFIIALVTGSLTSRLHLKETALRLREKRISDLYEISAATGNVTEIDGIIKNSFKLIEKFLNAKTLFFIVDENGELNESPHNSSSLQINEKEQSGVLWSFENNKESGRFTNTLPMLEGYYIPLAGISGIYGIIGFYFNDLKSLNLEYENFIKAVVKMIAIAIERFYLINKMQSIKLSIESERLYKIILNSISHELRTPLTSISNAVSGLSDKKMFNNKDIRNILLTDIKESSERMNRVVGNLLNMARLESGKLKLNLEWNDINDIVNVVQERLKERLVKYNFIKEISSDLPLLYADFGLIEQVLINLLFNTIQHNEEGIKILLRIYKKEDSIYFLIEDNGIGIPESSLNKIFDKFYRVSRSKTGGVGLGLSICKSIIELHGGEIFAQNNEENGLNVNFYLPLKDMNFKEDL